ncbi:SIMPL domain-containing protein [Luedemannella helvata]|uniref:SIMPL domain-containing protein n=1 Tax=Luedemannella helvata TaxID=349315 RepID=UPI0031D0A69D
MAALAVLSPGPLGSSPAFAAAPATTAPSLDGPSRDSVLVSGTGEVYGNPDTLITDLAVEITAATVSDAVDRANAAATRMRDALLRAGVARADIQTSSLSIGTRTNEDGATTGYTASQGFTVKIRNLPRAGDILSAGIAAGGNASRLYGVSFVMDNDAALVARARRGAFADARRTAELYAREAGRPLGRVLKITETASGCEGCDSSEASRGGFGGGAPGALEPGRHRLSVTVNVEWALNPPSR